MMECMVCCCRSRQKRQSKFAHLQEEHILGVEDLQPKNSDLEKGELVTKTFEFEVPEVDNDGRYPCSLCPGKSIKSKGQFVRHMKVVHYSGDKHVCKTCGYLFTTVEKLVQHRKMVHTRQVSCNLCEEIFRDKTGLLKHKEKVHQEPTELLQCPYDGCRNKFVTGDGFMKHLEDHESHRIEQKVHCTRCRRRFRTQQLYDEHIEACQQSRVQCSVCGSSFSNKKILDEHVQAVHTGHKCICPQCGKSLRWRAAFNKHKQICSARPLEDQPQLRRKKYFCSKCGKVFLHATYFKEHEKICLLGKTNFCQICSKRFTQKRNLADHVRAVHENKLYECGCGMTFKWRQIFYGHKKQCKVSK